MNWLKSYFTYPQSMRYGLAALMLITFFILLGYGTMPYWIGDRALPVDTALARQFEQYSLAHLQGSSPYDKSSEGSATGNSELFRFDPNTLDSMGFIRLGLRPKTIHLLINWRNKGKVFYKPEELSKVYTLSKDEYERIAPYISIAESNWNEERKSFGRPEIPASVDLNTTDSATLVLLRGIGPTLAHRIIEKRNALGGYLRHDQLLEVYRFPDSTYKMLQEKLIISPEKVKKIKINSATVEQMSRHPYIGEKLAKNILLLREGLKGFSEIEQLRQVPLMNEENYRKIAPYFELE